MDLVGHIVEWLRWNTSSNFQRALASKQRRKERGERNETSNPP
jgi:hypothetical protein